MLSANQILDRMSRELVSLYIQKQSGLNEEDDCVTIRRDPTNAGLFLVKMRSYNGNEVYNGLLSTNDMLAYLDRLFWVICGDEDASTSRISHVQYNIPAFPSVVVSVETLNADDNAYETFMDAMKFWVRTL